MVKLDDNDKRMYIEMGSRIRIAREKRGMSLAQLGKHIGVSESTMSRYESGETKVDLFVVKRIAEILNIKETWLLDWNGNNFYLNDETKELATYISEHPEQYILLDASRKLKPEDYKYVKELVERLAKKDEDNDN